MVLPLDTITAGVTVYLNMQKCEMIVARPTNPVLGKHLLDQPMIAEVYKLNNIDTALDFFEYIEKNRNRFTSVVIK